MDSNPPPPPQAAHGRYLEVPLGVHRSPSSVAVHTSLLSPAPALPKVTNPYADIGDDTNDVASSSQDTAAAQPTSILLQEGFNELILIHTLSFLPARDLVRFLLVNKEFNSLGSENVCRWLLSEARQAVIAGLRASGDLPLSFLTSKPTLERVALMEDPPRFPICYFAFGSNQVSPSETAKLGEVAALLKRHPTLTLRVEGRVQPDAPEYIKGRLSEARASAAAYAIYSQLILLNQDPAPSDELPSCITFAGMGSSPLSNQNFKDVREFKERVEALVNDAPRSHETYAMWSQLWRRIDITVVGI